ncbi:ATP-binding protein [Huintestinicola sp.]|uniref:ATP-binding protein n=1 Tax=Huintestinicola sp. TaxID=2981661 RepID=UPI003D7E1B2B
MKRKITQQLMEWKKSQTRKPLILNGARQVGKTFILREFGRENYKNTVYINLESNGTVASIFNDDISPSKLIKYLEAETGERILPNETLIILDEIQSCERAVTSLKYFCEEAPEYHIAAAGSLLGVAINRNQTSFPVGKVMVLRLYPLDFEEFLTATGNDFLIDEITECYTKMSPMNEGLHRKALDLYHDYLIVGGMPEAVKSYIETNSYIDAGLVQSSIIDSYTADMTKYANNSEAVKIRACYNSIPAQLAKDNKKFQYKVVQKGGSSTIFGASLEWLKQAGVTLECQRVDQGTMPLPVYADQTSFKIYMSDVGLLVNKSHMSVNTIITGESNIFMGAVTENYIAQQLAAKNYPLYYWTVANSQAELNFVLQKDDKIYAVEVKKGDHVRSRSLSVFRQKYSPDYAIRFSQKNFGKTEDVISIPLYAAFML